MRRISHLQFPVGVIQICWIEPGPSISAIINVLFAFISTEGLIFQPCPNSRAAPDPVPVSAFPPAPLAPLKFRSEEHTSELQSRENLVCRLLLEKTHAARRPPRPAPARHRRPRGRRGRRDG